MSSTEKRMLFGFAMMPSSLPVTLGLCHLVCILGFPLSIDSSVTIMTIGVPIAFILGVWLSPWR